jgi:hypothetical protein
MIAKLTLVLAVALLALLVQNLAIKASHAVCERLMSKNKIERIEIER